MANKVISVEEAVANVKDGSTIMVGGFLGIATPEIFMDALVKHGAKHLTVISNDAGTAEGLYGGREERGPAKLLSAGLVDHFIVGHVGLNPMVTDKVNDGSLKLTLVPLGTLAEKIRASAYGLGGILTPTGVGTLVETDPDELGREKQTLTLDGKKYLLEMPLKADVAFIRASVADEFGNFMGKKSTKNLNYDMAGAADKTIVAAEKIVKVGEIDPELFDIAGVLVDNVVGGEPKWEI